MNTQDSWLFHITKICTLEYNVKKSRDKIAIHYITYYRKFTQQYGYGNCCKSLYFFVLLEKKTIV